MQRNTKGQRISFIGQAPWLFNGEIQSTSGPKPVQIEVILPNASPHGGNKSPMKHEVSIYGWSRAASHCAYQGTGGVSLPDGADETRHRNGLMLMPWKGQRDLLSYVISICQPEWEDFTPLGETTSSCWPAGWVSAGRKFTGEIIVRSDDLGNTEAPTSLCVVHNLRSSERVLICKIGIEERVCQFITAGEELDMEIKQDHLVCKTCLSVTQIISGSFLSFSLTRLAHKSAGLSYQTSCQLSAIFFENK